MVFFVCEGCNETLKKNQVDKHASRCRQCKAVTCVDCSVTFYGNDYEKHVSCISEAEKYEGALYKGKKAKLNPQEAWLALLEESVSREDAPERVKPFLSRIAELGNAPRNKKKFVNFLKNSMRLNDTNLADLIWNYLEKLNEEKKKSLEVVPVVPVVAPTAAAAATSTESEEADRIAEKAAKKALKKARRQAEDEDTGAATAAAEDAAVSPSQEEKKAKKKKRRRELAVAVEEKIEKEEEEAEEVDTDLKKKKKKKKSKNTDE